VKIEFRMNYSVEVEKCNIDYLTAVFKQLLVMAFTDFAKTALEQFAGDFMKMEKKPFRCSCGNDRCFIWKTKDAKSMKITTIFADALILPQMQVQCKVCGKKMFISRPLLGIGRYRKMSLITQKILAFVGSLTTFRVSEKILGMFGVAFNRMKVWRCVQEVGKTISFNLDPKQLPSGEADGTGIPIAGIKKRGQELKVFIQKKIGGGARIAGLAIGKYDSGWGKLFAPLREQIMSFKQFLLVTDGDTSIFKGVKCLNVILQRCLWHIPHQLKHCLWADGAKRKSAGWMEIMGKIFDISSVRHGMEKDEIDAVLLEKRARLDGLISVCEKRGYKASASYLRNAKPDMFSALEKRLNGKSSSLVERVMRTVNMRVNVGKWTPGGALNAMNLRLAHYYNGWEPCESETTDIRIQRL
jgi:hypothetical protein